jgi:hypothetical protein
MIQFTLLLQNGKKENNADRESEATQKSVEKKQENKTNIIILMLLAWFSLFSIAFL